METQIYLDNASTTPVRQEVFDAMKPYLHATFGNPSSIHRTGQEARQAIEQARTVVANYIHASPSEIVFTAGGTEADFLALSGVLRAGGKRHIVTTQIEHHAVLHTCEMLDELGYETSYVAPDSRGIVDVSAILDAIRPDTGIVSVMWINNETGAMQPIELLAEELAIRGIPFHCDAVQALGTVPIDVSQIPVSLLSFSGHKIYGPKGTGAMYIRKNTPFRSLVRGGSQERSRRAGTENVSGIVGFAKAIELLSEERASRVEKVQDLSSTFLGILESRLSDWGINSPEIAVPHIINLFFKGVIAETLLMRLDLSGIAASGGSACTAGATELSHVLLAMGMSEEKVKSSLRFSFSSFNSEQEVVRAAKVVADIVEDLRNRSFSN